MWEKMYKKLKEKGVDVNSPGRKKGECLKPYVVIKMSGLNTHAVVSSNMEYYDVMCYVPHDKYSQLEGYKNTIKGYLKELYPMVRETGAETPSFYDDTVKGHMVSIMYVNYKKK